MRLHRGTILSRAAPLVLATRRLMFAIATLAAGIFLSGPVAAAPPTIYTVNTTADTPDALPGDGLCDTGVGVCTLRAAIAETNAGTGATIAFALSGAPAIAPASALPSLTVPVVIDGGSQACGSGPCVTLDGSGAGTSASGIVIAGGASLIERMIIVGFDDAGIVLDSASSVVRGSFVGTDGGAALANAVGVRVTGSDNIIGGAAAGERNVVSGNLIGLEVVGPDAGGNRIVGNAIGTSPDGTSAVPNTVAGVAVAQAQATDVGGTGLGEGNVISGNAIGVTVSGETTFTRIRGNMIGASASGSTAIPNGTGVVLVSTTDAFVGGTTTGSRNIISGNTGDGVSISGADTFGNEVLGNYIGTTTTGDAALANGGYGILIAGPVTDSVIGGQTAAARNVISGNTLGGVLLSGAEFNVVRGNYIGLSASADAAITQPVGVDMDGGRKNDIGGFTTADANVISGNGTGVRIRGGSSENLIYRNIIGPRPNGTTPQGNGSGVVVDAGAHGNRIGSATGDGNIIAFNNGDGVTIDGALSLGNAVRRNSIFSNAGRAIQNANGGNTESTPPLIATVSGAGVSGTACPGCSIDVYSDAVDEARTYHGSATAGVAGDWTLAVPPTGPNITATVTDAAGNTSEVALFDGDGDGVGDGYPLPVDNCPATPNPAQTNTDAYALLTPGAPSDITVPMSDVLGDACDADDDNDGISDQAEAAGCNASGPLDPLLADTDGDRSRDGAECAIGSNPASAASKPPGISPGESDNDGLSDALEAIIGSDPNDRDSDDDGVSDGIEFRGYSTSLVASDSDGDGCPDATEVASLNGDRVVSALDLLLIAQNFNSVTKPNLDATKDGVTNASDLVIVAANFQPIPCG